MRHPNKHGITAEALRELLIYEPDTGLLRWKVDRNVRVKAGAIAGRPSYKSAHLTVTFRSSQLMVHRVVWAMHYGIWPELDIDHIDGDPTNNRIENLREVVRGTNLQNQRKAHKDSLTGFLGVKHAYGGKFKAIIWYEGKTHHIGTFATPEQAHSAYVEVKRKVHVGCTL